MNFKSMTSFCWRMEAQKLESQGGHVSDNEVIWTRVVSPPSPRSVSSRACFQTFPSESQLPAFLGHECLSTMDTLTYGGVLGNEGWGYLSPQPGSGVDFEDGGHSVSVMQKQRKYLVKYCSLRILKSSAVNA